MTLEAAARLDALVNTWLRDKKFASRKLFCQFHKHNTLNQGYSSSGTSNGIIKLDLNNFICIDILTLSGLFSKKVSLNKELLTRVVIQFKIASNLFI